MTTYYLSNAFSLQMVETGEARSKKITIDQAKDLVGCQTSDSGWSEGKDRRRGFRGKSFLPAASVIGHADICRVINDILGLQIDGLKYETNRVSVSLMPGDVLVVGQYVGPRLPEGATELPEGAKIQWYRVDIISTETIEDENNRVKRLEKVSRVFENSVHDFCHLGADDPEPLKRAAERCFPDVFEGMLE